jgi:sigma-B regulation protein RsbU (phosphoserine phosphatase)
VAVFLVTSELERRAAALRSTVGYLARIEPAERAGWVRRTAPFLRERYPDLELVVRGGTVLTFPEGQAIQPPPPGWDDASGLVLKDGFLHLWARAARAGSDVTVLVPLTREFLADLTPNLGEVAVESLPDPGARSRLVRLPRTSNAEVSARPIRRLPPPANRFDIEVRWGATVATAIWDSPGEIQNDLLMIRSRPSAVLNIILAQKANLGQGLLLAAFVGIAALFLVEVFISVIIGVRITRTITGAVHELYEGTQRVMEGDFSHRIDVKGNDQLAQLGRSFNRMTENVERLLVVAKEKERLQSEVEIAREVQNQLYPRAVPELSRFRLRAHCNAARMVSGDYYDYQCLDPTRIAMAVGDVAGKGISAALLMATVQASLRTQIRACMEGAAAAGSTATQVSVSTSRLVAQLNQQLYANTSPEKFATFYFAVYDDRASELTYTNAGHLPPILLRRGEALRLEVNGTVVGAFPFSRYEESRVALESGDLIVCFTDGITEPENEYGEMFGEERLIEVVARNAERESEAIIAAVLESVAQWTGSAAEMSDDMTLLLARRT